MVTKKTWKEFEDTGLLWYVNTILHVFGWSICVEMKDDVITQAYPARVKFRGFNEKSNTSGYIKVSEYLNKNISDILEESKN